MGKPSVATAIEESIRGASASAAGDDFHELWALRKIMRLLDRKARLISVTVEGVPADEVHATLGDRAQAVDVTECFTDETGATSFAYEQLKYSAAHPEQAWSWARLTAEAGPRRKGTSILGKLAAAHHRLGAKGVVRVVSNQPAAEGLADQVAELARQLRAGATMDADEGLQRLRNATQLDDQALAAFLEAWDLSTFDSAGRLGLQGDILRQIGELTDADGRSDLALLQQHVSELILPGGRKHATVDRQTLLTWLGAGAVNALFPALSQIKSVGFVLERATTNALSQAIIGADAPFIRLDAPGGCGKTTFVSGLQANLPAGSVTVLYDCYGGGLFMSSDQRRHAPQQAFVEVANELAGAVGSPFVLSRPSSTDLTASFARRLRAAAKMVSSTDPQGLVLVVFDAVDNAVMAARKWNEPCFLDELLSLSDLPSNVRIVLTCRTGRRDWIKRADLIPLSLDAFSPGETQAFVHALRPTWPPNVAEGLHDLSGGTPRRLTYALDKTHDAQVALARLIPKAAGMDPLFDHLVAEAGTRLGDPDAVWRVLCALAHIPRPCPAWALAQVAGLVESDIADIAADVGGIVEHSEGWTFQDEDFEGFVDERTAKDAPALLSRAVAVISPLADSRPYAARSLAELLMRAGDLAALYTLVLANTPIPCITDEIDRRTVQARRMAIALNCCRQARDPITAVGLLLASAKGLKADEAIRDIIIGNLDLAAALAPDAALRLLTTHRRFASRRGPLRVQLAAWACADRAAIGKHMRWWQAWLAERQNRTPKWRLETSDIVADAIATFNAAGFDAAVARIRTWTPAAAMPPIIRELLRRASRTAPDTLWEALTARPRRPEVILTILAQLARSGHASADPRFGRALQSIATSTAWLRRQHLDQTEVVPLLEDLLFLCEATISRSELRASIGRLLDAAFIDHDMSQASGVYRFIGSGNRARALALHETLKGRRSSIESRLPSRASTPYPVDYVHGRPIQLTKEQEAANRACSDLNKAIEDALSTLTPLLETARARIDAMAGTATWDLALSAVTRTAHTVERSGRGSTQSYRLQGGLTGQLTSLLQHMTLAGKLTPERLQQVIDLLDANAAYRVGSPVLRALSALSWVPRADDLILEAAAAQAPAIEHQSRASSERAKDLVELSRIVLDMDPELARDAFERAIRVVEHIDIQTASQLRVIAALGHPNLTDDRALAQALAERLADAAGAVDQFLGNDDSFPWTPIVEGLAAIDLPTAYAAISRWRDMGLLELDHAISALLHSRTGRALPAPVVAALTTLAGQVDSDTPAFANREQALAWMDYQATDALVAANEAQSQEVADQARTRGLPTPSLLDEAVRLFEAWDQEADEAAPGTNAIESDEEPPPSLSPWVQPFGSEAELRSALEAVDATNYMVSSEVRAIANRVERLPLRVPLLRLVLERFPTSRALGEIIQHRYAEWATYPPVANFARDHLPDYLIESLPDLFQYNYHDTEMLEAVLEATQQDAAGQCEILFKAIAQQAHVMNSDLMYALLYAISRRLPPSQRAPLMEGLLDEIEHQVDKSSPVRVRGANAPASDEAALAGLLFAAMGDVNRRTRWRASHATRRLVSLGGDSVLASMAPMLLIEAPAPFAATEARFYTFSARQQLAATLHRLTLEIPGAVRPHVPHLVTSALEKEPHVVVTSFAKAAALAIEAAFPGSLTPEEKTRLEGLNVSPFKALSAKQRDRPRPPRSTPKGQRRCRFDDTDTVPYWFSPAARAFDVDFSTFLDRIEHWIVDQWGFDADYGYWAKEPRAARFQSGDSTHRHGSIPAMERLSRYADWHGLMCAMGECVRLFPTVFDYGQNEWDAWLGNRLLTVPGAWLSDLRDPPPLEPRFWRTSEDDRDAVAETGWPQSRFDLELGGAGDDELTVAGHITRQCEEWSETITISSALVSSATAMALGRALQTARDRMDYILPPAHDHRSIDELGYVLTGWLVDGRDEAGFDQHDPWRGRVNGLPVMPSSKVIKKLSLNLDLPKRRWIGDQHANCMLGFSIWGDREEEGLTSGWRARASRDLLRPMLRGVGHSLIIEIVISGSIGKSWEERRSGRRFYVVRPNGTVEKVPTARRGWACRMVRALGLDQSVDTYGRWLLHRAEELAGQLADASASTAGVEAELEAVIRTFQHRPR